MATRTFRSITDELPAGTVAASSSITDTGPDVYVHGYTNQEEYEAWMERVRKDESIRPSEREDIIAGSVPPEETFEEYMERHADE